MKITKRKLRRIIRETIVAEAGYLGSARWVPGISDGRLLTAVTHVLSKYPGISGAELVGAVNQMHRDIPAESIWDFLDTLQEDGAVIFDVEEDAWSLA